MAIADKTNGNRATFVSIRAESIMSIAAVDPSEPFFAFASTLVKRAGKHGASSMWMDRFQKALSFDVRLVDVRL